MARFFYILLGLVLFAFINLPKEWADRWRSGVVFAVSPLWQAVTPSSLDVAQSENEAIQAWVAEEKQLQSQMDTLSALLGQKDADGSLSRRIAREKQIIAMRHEAILARVIFRDIASWSSSLWISVGESDNQILGHPVIAVNSPVMANHALIGVVEYVGETQSRVRLITDAGLVPAVRAVRGGSQNQELFQHIQNVLTRVETRADLFENIEEQQRFIDMLSTFKNRLRDGEEEEMAKGEICGSSAPYFRAHGSILKGTGFNCDFPDEAGPARDIKSGRPIGVSSAPMIPLIQPGDLLITSGLDGVFPPGLPVAIATKVFPLKEGGFTYDLEAKGAAGDLLHLNVVFVLPPVGSAGKM